MVIFGLVLLEGRQFGGHSFDISLMRPPPNAYLALTGCAAMVGIGADRRGYACR